MPSRCPVCFEKLDVVKLHCPTCDTTIEGSFETCKFCQLTNEQRDFMETFIRCRGNIKEVERELGISYPTVRGRLDSLITALGYRVDTEEQEVDASRRREILESLNKGEISAEDALKALKQV